MFGFFFSPKRRPTPLERRPIRTGLRLETLEDRTAPALLTVNTLIDGPINHADALLTLREAVAVVNSGSLAGLSAGELNQVVGNLGESDTIAFQGKGVLSLTQGELTLTASVKISGPGAGALTIERSAAAASAFRLFQVQDPTADVTLENLTLARGAPAPNQSGGGILNSGLLTLNNVTMIQNTVSGETGRGGAIENRGILTVNYSTFTSNTAVRGGAIDQDTDTAALFVFNSTFNLNQAVLGEGTGGDGGALAVTGVANIANSTFSTNNAANNGGAIASSGTVIITNSTIALNNADADNTNTGAGGGIAGDVTTLLFNSIVAGNGRGVARAASDILGVLLDASSNNVIGDAATAGGLVHGANKNKIGFNVAAIIETTLKNNGGLTKTHALVQNSPALMAGSSDVSGFAITDQRDAARDPGVPDAGAYESHHPLSPVGVPSTFDRTFQPRPSPDANTAFVKGLYQSTLLRAADPDGLASWVALLNSGTLNRNQVAVGFYNSIENRSNQVTSYYRYFLGREPDQAGLNGWVAELQRGVDEGTVMTNFILSPEFTGNNNNASFVNLMYFAVLSRQADPAGFNDWLSQLDRGTINRAQVVNGFLRSTESLGRVVDSFFVTYLKRVPDAASRSAFVGQLQGGASFTTTAVTLLGSAEFFEQAKANM